MTWFKKLKKKTKTPLVLVYIYIYIYSHAARTDLTNSLSLSLSLSLSRHPSLSSITYIYIYRLIGLVGRMFANNPGDQGSIPGRVIPKTLKMILDTYLLSITRYVSRVKWCNLGKGVSPSCTPRCSSYWKGSLRVALDYGRQLTYVGYLGFMAYQPLEIVYRQIHFYVNSPISDNSI